MARDSFLEILKLMRFDDKPNRVKRGPGAHKFAPIRDALKGFPHCAKADTFVISHLLLASS